MGRAALEEVKLDIANAAAGGAPARRRRRPGAAEH
jgi:hypothetical protein